MGSELEKKLTAKERRFIDEYFFTNFNAAQAARNAGYSEKSAKEIAYENLTKPHIKAEIKKRFEAESLGADETKNLIFDIAKADTNKYLKVIKREHTPRVEKHLSELINELQEDIAFEGQYAALAELHEEEYTRHCEMQEQRRKQILRYQLELKRDPSATKIVYGKTEWIEDTEYDLVAIAKDKAAGRIKSYKMTKDGPQIEFYPADAALRDVARIHGLFDDKLDVSMKGSVSPDRWLEENSDE